jgi:hypothetical protein
VRRCDRADRWLTVPRYWNWEDAVDFAFEWETDVASRIRDIVAETGRTSDFPDDWSFQDRAYDILRAVNGEGAKLPQAVGRSPTTARFPPWEFQPV